MIEKVYAYAQRHRMFSPGCRVGVAVSGGADSVCLLNVLREIAPRWNLRLEVLHLDHGLRGEASAADAEFVGRMAVGFGLPFHLRAAGPLTGNLEEAGREARRAFFLEFLRSGRLDRVALGHTRNDQAETLLFRLLRGSSPAGLAAMRPVAGEGFVRPLLDSTRADVEAFLRGRGLAWREDATNRDPAFSRNRIRHELLPRLAAEWNPRLTEALARTAVLLQEDEAYWAAELARLEPEFIRRQQDAVLVDAARVRESPPPLARRILRRAVELAKGDLLALEFTHLDAILELAAQPEGDGRLQVPGLDVWRSFDLIRLAPPGHAPVQCGKSLLSLEFPEPNGYTGGDGDLDRRRVRAPLELRCWKPGDRYRPRGYARAEKLKDLFQEARIPSWERALWPIVTMEEEIVWVRGFGPAAEYAAGSGCGEILRISLVDESR